MDWIKVSDQAPTVGSIVWGKSAFGNAFKGRVKKSKNGYSLRMDNGQTLHNFKEWATYEVQY